MNSLPLNKIFKLYANPYIKIFYGIESTCKLILRFNEKKETCKHPHFLPASLDTVSNTSDNYKSSSQARFAFLF